MELKTVVLIVFVIIIVSVLATPSSKSVVPTPDDASLVRTATGNIEVKPKVKFIELKKIAKTPSGNPAYAGIMNIKKIVIVPEDVVTGNSTITATASSSMGTSTADQVVNYDNPNSMWHSKITSEPGEWIRVELGTPVALKFITIMNREDVAGGPDDESERIVGTQVTIMDAGSKPIKTYVITQKANMIKFALNE